MRRAPPHRQVRPLALLIALLLAGCADPGPARIPSYRYLEQNAPSSRDFQPPNSLPP